MKKELKTIFSVALLCIISSCNNDDLQPKNRNELQAVNQKFQNVSATYVVDYFKRNLESENLEVVEQSYYDKVVSTDSLKSEKERIWKLWKDANISRLGTLPSTNANGTEFIWDIPQGQRMKIKTFTKGSKPVSGYPFFINLHGGGGYSNLSGPWESSTNSGEWSAAQTLGKAYQDNPSYYFVPRMADDRIGRWYYRPQQTTWLRAWQLAVLSNEIDPDRTYILGISEGGYGSFRMGTFYADYFAGVGPMAGPETKEAAPIENLRNTSIRIEVGEFDTGFGRNEMGKSWKQRLDSAASANPGYFNHVVTIQPGKGHGINYYNVTPWLIQQKKRDTYPDILSFMYYDTDGGYRKGFGYVRLDGLNKIGGRKSFEIKKEGNSYDITTKDIKGVVSGKISLYVDKVDFSKPIVVTLNGKEVYNGNVKNSLGVMVESIALFGDPGRIYSSKIDINI
ncbi:hypothetical protein HZQ44_03090 [Elizabethkingia anophelis]|nr:hypothetical protein [Elizabethkingia anophelis]MCT3694627.1 hypothetical protein [Elizabethkingia anophelis]MCT3858145.1 hypothetical protein [Elizabethkingia anophelis]MCT3911437.1 hypothetical protein [Elizabethkingia anophelis]MCT4311016.1 hypothetical protein [Elizabethkingia anophelis]